VRDETKYHKMLAFARALPKIRRRVKRDLARRGLPKVKVLAAIVRLLETTLIRVGNDEYAQANRSFGLTTMRNRHVRIGRRKLHFEFRGKSGVEHEADLEDRQLARVVSACQDLPGQELFEYLDDEGQPHDVDSADVNDYLRQIAGDEFTAKDFRTWAGTVLAARALCRAEICDSKVATKRTIARAIEHVAGELGNTKAVCRKCYIHPDILDAYGDGSLRDAMKPHGRRMPATTRLSQEEKCVLKLLEMRRKRAKPQKDERTK
jgi:DNA topoisomerase-1